MKLTLKQRREKNSRLRFLKQQTSWLKGDLKQKYPYSGKAKIKKWITENIKEIENLKNELN
jgi:hypothetical protein